MKRNTLSILTASLLAFASINLAHASEELPYTSQVNISSMSILDFKKTYTNTIRVIVSSDYEIDDSLLSTIHDQTGYVLKFDRNFLKKYKLLLVASNEEAEIVVRKLDVTGYFNSVELDAVFKTQSLTDVRTNDYISDLSSYNDPLISSLYYLKNQESDINGSGYSNVSEAMTKSVKNKKLRIAVIDTGSLQHEDLNVVEGYKFATQITNERGTSFYDRTSYADPADTTKTLTCYDGHGTKMSGLISAKSNNNLGFVGIVDADIISARVLEQDCNTKQSIGNLVDVADAISWVQGESVSDVANISQPVDMINLSLGGVTSAGCPQFLQDVIDSAISKGIIVVTASGNENLDVLSYATAGCKNIITVAANDYTGQKTKYSNFGNRVAVSALGNGYSTVSPVKYDSATGNYSLTPNEYSLAVSDDDTSAQKGSSFSSALVTGALGLVKQKYPDWTDESFLLKAISQTSTPHTYLGGGNDTDCTNGRCGAGVFNASAIMDFSDRVLGYDKKNNPFFESYKTCQDNVLLEGINYYIDVCSVYKLSITNNNEIDGTYYEVYSTSLTDVNWESKTLLKSTTTDSNDRMLTLSGIDLGKYKYGVRYCDDFDCYSIEEIKFNEANKPSICN